MNLKKKKKLKAASRPPLPIQLIILPTIIKVWQLDCHFINPILGTDSGLTNTSGVLILPGVVLVPLSLIRIFNLVENSSVNCQWFVPFNVYNYDNKKLQYFFLVSALLQSTIPILFFTKMCRFFISPWRSTNQNP